MQLAKWSKNRGNALLGVLAAAVIGAGVMLAMSKLLTTSSKALKSTELGGELQQISATIFGQLDCAATLGTTDPNGATCNSTSAVNGQDSAGVYLRLRRKTLDGSVKYLTPPLVGGVGKLGSWSLRATCSAAEQSLVIRAARPKGTGFEKDFTGQTADWASPKGLLFSGLPGEIPLCYGAPSTAGLPKRFAVLRLSFSVQNNNTEYIQIDLKGASPSVVASSSASMSYSNVTEPFQSTGTMAGIASINYADVRNAYYNVTAMNSPALTFPSPGVIRVSLGARGDIGWGGPPQGGTSVTVLVYQK